jgi:hypothetical protein
MDTRKINLLNYLTELIILDNPPRVKIDLCRYRKAVLDCLLTETDSFVEQLIRYYNQRYTKAGSAGESPLGTLGLGLV